MFQQIRVFLPFEIEFSKFGVTRIAKFLYWTQKFLLLRTGYFITVEIILIIFKKKYFILEYLWKKNLFNKILPWINGLCLLNVTLCIPIDGVPKTNNRKLNKPYTWNCSTIHFRKPPSVRLLFAILSSLSA